ncbi:MAG: zinc ribbon domain-containing protein [Desulfococcaceae bacterium]|jgi:hypothetical protein|nr:zinc ribbon domain-containing protein [Desulfococcaceae bacterium]
MAKPAPPSFCPKCGYKGNRPSAQTCAKCGAKIKKAGIPPSFSVNRGLLIFILIIAAAAGGIVFLFFSNENVANELRQIRQPRPNRFFVGIDVSATISTDILEKLKDSVTERLRQFIGDSRVSYDIKTFGNPGCGERSFSTVVSAQSPEDESTFAWKVRDKIGKISITKIAPRDTTPLTTPFYLFLENELADKKGSRVIIFSDLMNDDSDCPRQHIFPENVITEFGTDKNGQLVFLYPTPPQTDNQELNQRTLDKQQEFITRMKKMGSEGKVRVFFYHIPDDPLERIDFIKSQLENAIPATMFDVVWERTGKVLTTIVSAVRG